MDSDIFVKNDEITYVDKFQIMNTIPKGAQKCEQSKLIDKGFTEWRWRIYHFDNKDFVEISKKERNVDRIYLSKDRKWIKYSLPNVYLTKVQDSYYYYANNDSN
jgi:hypothetical protein